MDKHSGCQIGAIHRCVLPSSRCIRKLLPRFRLVTNMNLKQPMVDGNGNHFAVTFVATQCGGATAGTDNAVHFRHPFRTRFMSSLGLLLDLFLLVKRERICDSFSAFRDLGDFVTWTDGFEYRLDGSGIDKLSTSE
jgi:hypothetical protein